MTTSDRRPHWGRTVTLAVWAALVSVSFAASAAARTEVHILDQPRILVRAHESASFVPRAFRAADNDDIEPRIAVTNVGPPLATLPSVTIAHHSQTLSLVVETGTTVEAPSTTSLPTVGGTTETSTSAPPGTDVEGDELSYTGPRGSLLWEIIAAATMIAMGSRLVVGGRRRRRGVHQA